MQRQATNHSKRDPKRPLQASRVGVPPSGGLGTLPAPPEGGTPTLAKRGFALVVALSMMAFVLVLLVSMTLLVQVETTNSRQALDQLRAKESARLALMMALGDLQRYAGPDQRVTARAEILGNARTTENPYWTGVWDTTSPTATPHWMVSWQDQSTNPNNRTLTLVDSGSVNNTSEYVSAPTIALSNSSGTTTGEIAWWVSDEGLKASVGLIDNSSDLADGFFSDYASNGLSIDEQRQIQQQLSARRHRTEVVHDNANFIPGETEDINDSSVASKIALSQINLTKVKTTNQLPILEGITDTELKAGFHALTATSKAVLSNTKLGGLKVDLSDQSYTSADAGLPIDANVTDFLWNSLVSPTSDIPLKGIQQTELDNALAGEVIHTTPAVITEFALYFVVSGQRVNSTTARAFLRFEAEVWSPYGFRHAFSGASGSDTPEIFVEFESLPDIQLKFYDKDTETFTNSTIFSFDQISPSFELDLTETHKSGEIRKSIGFWPVNAGSNQSNFYYTDQWSWTIDDPSYNSDHRRVSFPDGDSINYTSNSANITIALKNASGEILQRIENIPIGSMDTDFSYYEDSPSGLSASDAPIVFTYRMYSDKDDLEKWLTETDPRSAILDVSAPEIFELIDVNDVNGDDLGDADIPDTYFSNLDFFHGQPNNNFFRVFDLPATTPFSLGILQHLQIKDRPPFSIGNAWGGDLNNIFDRFFISGIPNNPSESYWDPEKESDKGTLPNPFIEISNSSNQILGLSDLNRFDSAQHLFTNGAFNVNSTSRKAWAAVLSSNSIYDWDYALNRGTSSEENYNRLNLENVFFRLPFSGHLRSESFTNWKFPFEDYELEIDLADDYPLLDESEKELTFRNSNGVNPDLDWRPSFSIGHREFNVNQLEQLAEKIVDNLEARERPFISLEEFVNSGILQQAINQTPINTIADGVAYNDASIDERIPRNATSYLSQADIMSALGCTLTPRGDTFRIRASARTLDEVTGTTLASAHCEVIVQRLPDRLDEQSTQTMNNATGFGRRFLIDNIIWLESSQL